MHSSTNSSCNEPNTPPNTPPNTSTSRPVLRQPQHDHCQTGSAFPRVTLAEGEYRAIAKNEGKVFERPFNVKNGVDGEVEVLAH